MKPGRCCHGLFLAALLLAGTVPGAISKAQNADRAAVRSDDGGLVLQLDGRAGGMAVALSLHGRQLLGQGGATSGAKIGNQWFTTHSLSSPPRVTALDSHSATVSNIHYTAGALDISETWRFLATSNGMIWTIDRDYLSGGRIDDLALPELDFKDMGEWTGGLLDEGGVVWTRLLRHPNASYAFHGKTVTFWNQEHPDGLRLSVDSPSQNVAMRFTHQPSGVFSVNATASSDSISPRHDLSRSEPDHQDIWGPLDIRPGHATARITLTALDYNAAYDRSQMPGLDARAVREICHTIARFGVVDDRIMGSNGHDGAVLHEPWIAQMGLAVDDPDYFSNLARTLDYQREHAIGADGRVKPRWAGHPGDEIPGTYDQFGFYECQWGWLMDCQPDWVINVAELFDLTGDAAWLRRQKETCERALDYVLRRDADGNGLLEMMAGSRLEAKASDWIDVVWASHENALVNAQMYFALVRWSGLENLLEDHSQAERYRAAALKLKNAFNKNIAAGGFWDPARKTYVYWREKDGSIHGTNFVVPVNFSAIGYGLCDDSNRCAQILDKTEELMKQERLFAWPLCFESFARDEVNAAVNWPFPAYENGDIFLAWAELGTRAYAAYKPAIAVKYIKSILAQYARDGLAFQRYLRKSQTGAGSDILANNCSAVVGLYRNIYGIQPRHDRLFLQPHLTPELSGANVNYWLRGVDYHIHFTTNDCKVTAGARAISSRHPFAVNFEGGALRFFATIDGLESLSVQPPPGAAWNVSILDWPGSFNSTCRWEESAPSSSTSVRHALGGLSPAASFQLSVNGVRAETLRSDAQGRVCFTRDFAAGSKSDFELTPLL